MKILHAYCLNYNVGDYALGFGVKNVLRQFMDVSLIAQTNLQGRDFNAYYISEVVNKKYDLLVIGGGGIIHGAHWPQGWFWLIEKEMLEKIEIPFVVYGAGYNYFPGEAGIPHRGIEHLRETQKRAAYFSVRNDGSDKRLFDATGIVANVIPDPGFHVPWGRDWGAPVGKDFVVLQLADDKAGYRYGNAEKRKLFIARMRGIVEALTKNYEVIAIPHVFDDIVISHDVVHGIAGAKVLNFSSYAFDQCDTVMRYYRDARFVLAMRGHGQIVPLGFGTPVITFSAHDKIKGMMESLNLNQYHVTINSESFVPEVLIRVAAIERDYSDVKTKIRRIGTALEQATASELAVVKSKI